MGEDSLELIVAQASYEFVADLMPASCMSHPTNVHAWFLVAFSFGVLGIEPKASSMLGKCSTASPNRHPPQAPNTGEWAQSLLFA